MSSAHTVKFVLHIRNAKIMMLRAYLEGPSKLPSFPPEITRQVFALEYKQIWRDMGESSTLPSWKVNKWLGEGEDFLSLQKSHF